MKKLIIVTISLFIILVILAALFAFPKNTWIGLRKNKVVQLEQIPDNKFGFTRSAMNIEQEKIKDTGATWFRPDFGYFAWGDMQKDANSPIDFSKTDQVVTDAQKEGLHLSVTVFPFADWDQKTSGTKCKVSDNDTGLPQKKGDFETEGLPYYRCNPNDWTAYAKWLTAVVERYDGDGQGDMPGLEIPIHHYEIVNEPDLTKDPVSGEGTVYYLDTPENYAVLLQKTYPVIKAADSNSQVLIAPMAGVQPEFQKYWARILATPKIADYFDIANIHCISSPNQNAEDSNADNLNVSTYKKLLSKYGITKPIWVTEAENIVGSNAQSNVKRLDMSVANAIKNGAEKIFFTGASLAGDPHGYTSEMLIQDKIYYTNIINEYKSVN